MDIRVGQVVASVSQESSGPSYSVPGLCRGLKAAGCSVELHVLDEIPCNLRNCGYGVVNYPRMKMFGRLGVSPEMARGLKGLSGRVDIIHNNGLWMMPNVYSAWAAKGSNVKFVMAPRGCLADWCLRKGYLKKKIFRAILQEKALRGADMFHATSEKEYEEIRSAGYVQPVAIVPIGMDLPALDEQEKGGKYKRLVFLGRIHKVKAVDRLIKAWEIVCGIAADWELLIAGPDAGVKNELEQFIAAKKLPRVRFVGEINGLAKYKFLSKADVYVLPSFTENFAVTVAEALACGVPVVVSKGTPWRRVVEKKCGMWVENAPSALADALLSMMKYSDHERKVLGASGREWIREEFSWEGVGDKMKAAYLWLLGMAEKPEFVYCS